MITHIGLDVSEAKEIINDFLEGAECYFSNRQLDALNLILITLDKSQAQLSAAEKDSQRLHFMIKNKYMFWEEFDRVEIRDQQGNYKGAGKDHITAIDDAMGKEQ